MKNWMSYYNQENNYKKDKDNQLMNKIDQLIEMFNYNNKYQMFLEDYN